MNDNMSLDEAIKHLVESLSETEKWKDREDCRKEHEQLLKWLIELQTRREFDTVDFKLCGDLTLSIKPTKE